MPVLSSALQEALTRELESQTHDKRGSDTTSSGALPTEVRKSVKRDLVCVKRDLVRVKRDLVRVKRDLVCVKRDQYVSKET